MYRVMWIDFIRLTKSCIFMTLFSYLYGIVLSLYNDKILGRENDFKTITITKSRESLILLWE